MQTEKCFKRQNISVSAVTFDNKSPTFVRFLYDLYWAVEDLKLATRNAAGVCSSKTRSAVELFRSNAPES